MIMLVSIILVEQNLTTDAIISVFQTLAVHSRSRSRRQKAANADGIIPLWPFGYQEVCRATDPFTTAV